MWAAVEAYGTEPGAARGEGGVNPLTATYLNRLSDLLFVLARCANLPGGDVLWQPGGGREQPPRKARLIADRPPRQARFGTSRVGDPQEVGMPGQATLML